MSSLEEVFPEEYLKAWNAYFYPDTEVFINKLNITDQDELARREAELSFERLVELNENPIKGNFDKEHLCKIHEYLFQDLYDWAGKYRNVYMAKNQSYFAPTEQIDFYLTQELEIMKEHARNIYSIEQLTSFITEYYVLLLNIHPFRQGNGRSIREFMREFVVEKTKDSYLGEYDLDWSLVDGDAIDRAMPLARVIRSPIEMEIRKALVPREKVKNLKKEF